MIRFYTIEAWDYVGYDGHVPGVGVVIYLVVTTRGDRPAQVVDADGNGNPNDAEAVLAVGDTVTHAANRVILSVLSGSPRPLPSTVSPAGTPPQSDSRSSTGAARVDPSSVAGPAHSGAVRP